MWAQTWTNQKTAAGQRHSKLSKSKSWLNNCYFAAQFEARQEQINEIPALRQHVNGIPALQQKINELSKQVGGIIRAFRPAFFWSLMEEGVYLALRTASDRGKIKLTDYTNEDFLQLEHQAAQCGGKLLAKLSDHEDAKEFCPGMNKSMKKCLGGEENALIDAIFYGVSAYLKCME